MCDVNERPRVYQEIREAIGTRVKELANTLMHNENKDFCMEGVSKYDWKCYYGDEARTYYVVVPAAHFRSLICDRQYLTAVSTHPKLFGTGKAIDVLEALMRCDQYPGVQNMCLCDYLKFLKAENMAYVFEVKDGKLNERILRLDLFRDISNDQKDFLGGLFHAFKHFTVEGYGTISYKNGELKVPFLERIISYVILNFFSDKFEKEKEDEDDNVYIAHNEIESDDIEHPAKGVYYKQYGIPVYFLNSLHIEDKK
ncbi:MAG: hypothetical protein LUC86_07745 [Prevotellaceae bacterium]|nr:hypothetical protein [Prevotellaceae bacterium]